MALWVGCGAGCTAGLGDIGVVIPHRVGATVGVCYRPCRATVVAGPKIVQPLSIESYTEGVRKQGREHGRTLVGLDTEPADAASVGACPAPLASRWAIALGVFDVQ
jgi:hypothetical protein